MIPIFVHQRNDYIAQMRTATATSKFTISQSKTPSGLDYWLGLTASMTHAITENFGKIPTVRVLSENIERSTTTEQQQLRSKEPVYARHVLLCIDDEPLIMARTITPISSPDIPAIQSLSDKSLAELLFSDQRWQRRSFLQPMILANGVIGRSCLWRQATIGKSALLVEEFFLSRFHCASGLLPKRC